VSFPRDGHNLHWTCLDPTTIQGTREEILAAFRRARDQIRDQLDRWLPEVLS
jgi:arsenate reductase